ncbi:unnamed protein product [Plutella xylostella]|uniref:(diamondback moth) hypothetical protein n=1 Tax=Plutella xylostella TaxID=51655 RepID=A0A8S4FCI4_PLUXY|nr:unnamed protein product [Plutella xylostella]
MSFPDDVEVISEPGQYFAAAPFTLAVMVYSIKQVSCEYEHEKAKTSTMYFINDGVYGSFGDRIYDSKQYFPELLQPRPSTPEPCSIWGPTADALDLVVPAADLLASPARRGLAALPRHGRLLHGPSEDLQRVSRARSKDVLR